ncbi:MAG: tetratricopeptide (TPR) repeat protein [Parvibaculaceae bacterium]|jgi:tetratricopeptide (TPR) repeat protein|nr:hypothetical protein [Parvibaculaceae bacterium]
MTFYPSTQPSFRAKLIAAALFTSSLLFGGLASPPAAHAETYSSCLAAISEDADASYDVALAWYAQGGGAAALHCAALALTELKLYDGAAERLEELAKRPDAGSEIERAQILEQAGNAWMLAGKPTKAAAAFSNAMSFLPGDIALQLSRARIYLFAGNHSAALSDLDAVITKRPFWGEAYLLRGRTHRLTGKLRFASADLEMALSKGAAAVTTRLERGLVRQALGDLDGAREDWIYVQGAASPQDPAAVAARSYLAQMDVNVEPEVGAP